MTQPDLSAAMANAIRALAMDAVEKARSGHPGLPLGAADVATVLFTRHLKYDASDPHWPDRDRFVLSAGHGSMLLYALLYLTGTLGVSLDDLKSFRQLGSRTPGHPEYGHTPGVETTTGPLGQGIATAVGMALAERVMAAEFGADIVDHHTYVLASDGDLMEGVSQEAIALAGHLNLSRLIVLFDDNGISIDGPLSLSDSVDQVKRFEAAGWCAVRVDGHDANAVDRAIAQARTATRPTLIACKTVIGFGSPKKAGTSKVHGEPLGQEEIAATKAALNLSPEAFSVPDAVLAAWREAGLRGRAEREAWDLRLAGRDQDDRAHFIRRIEGSMPAALGEAVGALKRSLAEAPPTVATRKASEITLEAIVPAVPALLIGSADLTPSNNTRTRAAKAVTATDFSGHYVHYGIRDHAMAAAMNGIALHGGLVPAGATFMVFTDYCRPAIRLSALMGLRVVYVMTHDSIGLGEDGPTHQPVEHLAALRAIPNLNLFRPADATETAECWELALNARSRPSVLALTRQNLAPLRTRFQAGNVCAQGAYEAVASDGKAFVSLFASGSEVEIAVAARALLQAKGIGARVISVPCLDLFHEQDASYRSAVIGSAPVKVAIEAGIRMPWDSVIGHDGLFIGMAGFGASGPYRDLYAHFGITPEAVAAAAEAAVNRL